MRVQREDAATGEEERVNPLDRAHRLQHHDHRLARRRAVVVDAGGNRRIEEDRGAPGRPPRIGEVSDADAAHVGERPAGCLTILSLRVAGDCGRRQRLREFPAVHDRPPLCAPVVREEMSAS